MKIPKCSKHVSRWTCFRYIILPWALWYLTGRFVWDEAYSWWYLNVLKRKPYWSDADPNGCTMRYYCRYCGKGQKHT